MNDAQNVPNSEGTEKETTSQSMKMEEPTVSPAALEKILQKYYFLEEMPIIKTKTITTNHCQEIFQKPIKTGWGNISPQKKLPKTLHIRNPYEDMSFPMEGIGKDEPF